MTTSITSLTMTSREIAELVGKKHAHVMRDIRAMFEQLRADPNLSCRYDVATYEDEQGKTREMYRLDKAATICLVGGYDPVIRMRMIQHWQALETQKRELRTVTAEQLLADAQRLVDMEQCGQLPSDWWWS